MAEEILVKENLSPEMISDGRALLAQLDAAGWPATSAFWLFNAERNRWELVLSSPDVQMRGSRPGYETVRQILIRGEVSGLSLGDITILPPRKEIVKLISRAVSVNGGGGVRYSRNAIDGHYIEDAFIYRS
jgi:hypothetical protein